MKKKPHLFPLTFEEINQLLGNKNEVTKELNYIVVVKKNQNDQKVLEEIENYLFKNIYDTWGKNKSVVVGEHLLTTAKLKSYDLVSDVVVNKSPKNTVLMNIKAQILIEKDPEPLEDVKYEKNTKVVISKEIERDYCGVSEPSVGMTGVVVNEDNTPAFHTCVRFLATDLGYSYDKEYDDKHKKYVMIYVPNENIEEIKKPVKKLKK